MFNADFKEFFGRTLSGGLDQDPAFQRWWQEQVFRRWWDEDWSWDGPYPDMRDYWNAEANALISFAGRRWTRFHLPLHDLEGNSSPKASWSDKEYAAFEQDIVDLLKTKPNGAVDLSGVVFPRDIDFGQLAVPIESYFSSAWFYGHTSFNGVQLKDNVKFEKAVFVGDVQFLQTLLGLTANFREVVFRRSINFTEAKFAISGDFDHSIFLAGANFKEITFGDDASFNNTHFKNGPNFKGADFGAQSVRFIGAVLGTNASFENALFVKKALFQKTQFGHHANFCGATFVEEPKFLECTFSDDASFDRAQFNAKAQSDTEARFDSVIFGDKTSFRGTIFNDIKWHDVKFGNDASFEEAIFNHGCFFAQASFASGATFTKARFSKKLKFHGLVFQGNTSFDEAIFDEGILFDGSSLQNISFHKVFFEQSTTFIGCIFGKNISFKGATFGKNMDFSVPFSASQDGSTTFAQIFFDNAKFLGDVTFANRRFTHQTSFAEAVFHGLPGFHDAKLHQDTDFRGTKFLGTQSLLKKLRARKPKGTFVFTATWRAWRWQNKVERNKYASQLERAYRTLKLDMHEKSAHNEEARFFTKELECRRLQSTVPLLERWFAALYKWTSGYGESLTRPLLFWLLVQGIAGFVYSQLAPSISEPKWQEVFRFTLEQSVRPFAIWTEKYRAAYENDWIASILKQEPGPYLEVIASFQTILSLGLIFLFFLALRRRFRMG